MGRSMRLPYYYCPSAAAWWIGGSTLLLIVGAHVQFIGGTWGSLRFVRQVDSIGLTD